MQVPLVEEAHKEGLSVIVTDLSSDCACAKIADIFEPINIFDIEAHIALATQLTDQGARIVGVLAAGIDAPETMARLAKHLNLPGVDPEIAHLVNHKDLFRERLRQLGYPVPKFSVIDHSNNDQLDELISQIGFPVIVKNTSSSGSRGTKIFSKPDYEGVRETVEIARSVSRSGRALLEQVWVGHEVTVETLFDCNGVFHPCFITDRFFDKSDGFALEIGLRNPAKLPPKIEEELYDIAKNVARDLGIKIGAAKYDMMLTEEGPRIIEMTVRLSGGFDCQYLVPASTGKQVLRAAMLTAMGKPFDPTTLQDHKHRVGLSVSLWPAPGRIVSITGLDAAREIPGVEQIFFRSQLGDIVEPYIDCTKRVCFIIVTGKTEEEANRVVEHVKATLHIETEAV